MSLYEHEAKGNVVFRAGPGSPHEICGEEKGCSSFDNGLHFCRHRQGPVPGWDYLGQAQGDTQWAIYRRAAPLDALQARFEAALGPDELARLSAILDSVPGDALKAVGYGWDPAKRAFTGAFFDAAAMICGIAYRSPTTGSKWMVNGSKPGVVVVDEWLGRPGCLVVVEGHSDTAAGGAAGLRVIGRPNNSGGADEVAAMLGRHPVADDILVVVENDQKPDDDWPGRTGSESFARKLVRLIGRPVKLAVVPDGHKDPRSWLTATDRKDVPWAERGRQLVEKLVAVAEAVTPPEVRAFQFGDRVRPSDRNNVGTVVEVLGNGRYKVEFVGENGTAEKKFDAADLKLDDGRPAERDTPPAPPPSPPPPWVPFPIEPLPKVLRDFVTAAAESLVADPCLVAVPALVGGAGAIGNSRAVKIKDDWVEPAVLWGALVAEPGGKKTPALGKAFAPHWHEQATLDAEYRQKWRAWEAEREAAKAASRPPNVSLKPRRRDVVVDDITVEALAERLEDNPRGLLCPPDELRKLIDGFGKYQSGAKGSDRAFWLSAHDAQPAKVDRKTGDRPSISVRRAAVSVCGGAQPRVWAAAICNAEADEDGLAARLLHAMPPDRDGWTDYVIPETVAAAYRKVVDTLYQLPVPEDGPTALPLTPAGRAAFIALVNSAAQRKLVAEPWERAILAKAPKHAARLGLVLQLFHDPGATEVATEWLEAAIALTWWFYGEACRVRCVLGASNSDQRLDRLERLADRHDGRLSPGDLIKANDRVYPTSAVATAALDELVARRAQSWAWVEVAPGPKGGRPSRQVQRVQATPPQPDGPSDAPGKTGETSSPAAGPSAEESFTGFTGRSQMSEAGPAGADEPDLVDVPGDSDPPPDTGGIGWSMRI